MSPPSPSLPLSAEFPYSLTIDTPFPDHRLASTAKSAIEVDAELSSLVRRTLSVVSPPDETEGGSHAGQGAQTVLRTEYRATTNRMLRVAVNGFMESLGVVLEVMQELDVDVLEARGGATVGVNGET